MSESSLGFDNLLHLALQDWPAALELVTVEHDSSGRYSVEGLGVLAEEISIRHIGNRDEVIMRNIHEAMLEVLHAVAQYVSRIELVMLRGDAVRTRFERRLLEVLKDSEPGWDAYDLDIIRSYFVENVPRIE